MLLSGRYPELFFLICHVPEPTGLSLPVKDFLYWKKFKKTPSSSCFLVASAAVFAVVLSLLGDYAVREEHCTLKHGHLFALSEPSTRHPCTRGFYYMHSCAWHTPDRSIPTCLY